MNIFVFSQDPDMCARWHCDAHINSQIKEMCQMMGTAYRMVGISKLRTAEFPQITHQNHPCAVWLRESTANWDWSYRLLKSLFIEKRRRFHSPHEYEKYLADFEFSPMDVHNRMTPFAQAMPEQYRIPFDAPLAYRRYFITEKRHLAKWYGNQIPVWYI